MQNARESVSNAWRALLAQAVPFLVMVLPVPRAAPAPVLAARGRRDPALSGGIGRFAPRPPGPQAPLFFVTNSSDGRAAPGLRPAAPAARA